MIHVSQAVNYARFVFGSKMTLFAPSVCDFICELPCRSVESYARLLRARKNKRFTFFVVYRDHSRTTYQVPVPGVYSKQQFAAGTPIVLLYEKGDAVGIEPRPPSPNTRRFCARSSRTLFRLQASGDGTRMQGVLGESRASCWLSIISNKAFHGWYRRDGMVLF